MNSSASCSKRSTIPARRLIGALVACLLTTVGVVLGVAPSRAVPASSAAVSAKGTGGACRLPYGPGQHTLTVLSGGLHRTVVIYIPDGYDGRRRLPLVLTLHGNLSTGSRQLGLSELVFIADQYDFILAAPQGHLRGQYGYRWNLPGVNLPAGRPSEDEKFLNDAIAYLTANLCVDAKRIYGSGYAEGGQMISQYACDFSDRLAAIGTVAGLSAGYRINDPGEPVPDPATCRPSRAMPVITFAGTADEFYSYANVEAAVARWAQLNLCRQGPRVDAVSATVSKLTYFACRRNAPVVLYRVAGGGHTWPGNEIFVPLVPVFGPVTFDIKANELIWSFFTKHRLPVAAHR